MTPEPIETIRHSHLPFQGGVDVVHATYVRHTFSRHFHEDYALGVIENGALGFHYRGENVVASPGMICLVIPGEIHDGHPALADGWTYRIFYLNQDLMRSAAGQLTGKPAGLPFFKPGVIQSPRMAEEIRRTHGLMENDSIPTLEKETRFVQMLTRFIARHSSPRPDLLEPGREHSAVSRACHYIQDNYDRDISIRGLAAVAGLSPFHFIRVFKTHKGLPPHAYLMQVRTQRARQRLRQGDPPAEAAAGSGFTDQSHFTRHFKQLFGITPGRYRNSVQDRTRSAR